VASWKGTQRARRILPKGSEVGKRENETGVVILLAAGEQPGMTSGASC
jgi:hypothetical protein